MTIQFATYYFVNSRARRQLAAVAQVQDIKHSADETVDFKDVECHED
jgi:hypothetical protein